MAANTPTVWVLTDDRTGNTRQSTALAEALGWPWTEKPLHFGPLARLHNRVLGSSRVGISRARSARLAPPWPDLLIAAGRRTAPVALWVRRHSGGRTRLVQLGRKGGDFADLFDLSVTPAYTRLFEHPRREIVRAPLHGLDFGVAERALTEWPELEALPRPRFGVLLGGHSGQYRLGPATAGALGREAAALARAANGVVVASTSRRTPPTSVDTFAAALAPGDFLHRWSAGAARNPYPALLAACDAVVVTGDSESMLAEAVAATRRVWVYPLPERRSFAPLRRPRELVTAGARRSAGLGRLCRWSIERGWVRPARDLSVLHADLVGAGLAAPFGAEALPPEPAGHEGPFPDLERVRVRVEALMHAAPGRG